MLFGEVSIAYCQGLQIEVLWASYIHIKTFHKFKKIQNSNSKLLTFFWFSDTCTKIHVPNTLLWTVSCSNLSIYLRKYHSRLCKFKNFWILLPNIEEILITRKINHTLKYSKDHKIWTKVGIELKFSGFVPLNDTNRI